MIVDLIRNDLSRLTRPGGVRVPRLFHTQAWPTVWQMSSDVEAELREAVSLREIFEALFPCGSVTGAPKVRAMHWIRRLEGGPRGVYCGAMGVVRPGGDATFNVPIRTVEIVQGRARCGIGSAITADARARSEAREWRVKRAFLERAARPFQILETMRLEGGEVAHWPLHRARLLRAARHFGHPCDESALEEAVRSAMDSWPEPAGRLRLLLDAEGKVSVEVGALPETPECPSDARPLAYRWHERVRALQDDSTRGLRGARPRRGYSTPCCGMNPVRSPNSRAATSRCVLVRRGIPRRCAVACSMA